MTDWPTWKETRADIDVDESAVAATIAELKAAEAEWRGPEPVECPACWGDGAVHIWNGQDTLRAPCDKCFGQGITEPDA